MRTKCPFYGFALWGDVLSDTKGNQCPLILSSSTPCGLPLSLYTPCKREIEGLDIDWKQCISDLSWMNYNPSKNEKIFFIKEDMIERIIRETMISPDELRPTDGGSWNGIPFSVWYDHIINRKAIDLIYLTVSTKHPN